MRTSGVALGGAGVLLSVTSGKGGIGKTMVATNLAAALQQQGQRVLLVDLDLHHPNVHIALGMQSVRVVADVLAGLPAREAIFGASCGVDVLAGRSGYAPAPVPAVALRRLIDGVEQLSADYDVILFDHAPGLADAAFNELLGRAPALLLVGGIDSLSLTDAYALYKHAHRVDPLVRGGLVLNRCSTELTYDRCMERFVAAARRFLDSTVHPLGWIPYSRRLARSGRGVEIVAGPVAAEAAGRAISAMAPVVLEFARGPAAPARQPSG